MRQKGLEQSDSASRSPITGEYRYFLIAVLAGASLTGIGCEEDEKQPAAPARGMSCVTVLNQDDKPMEGCHFDYKIPQSILDEDAAYFAKWGSGKTPDNPCNGNGGAGGNGGMGGATEKLPERLFVYGVPGEYKINAKCDEGYNKFVGHVNVDIGKAEDDEYSSKLINSACTDGYKFITDFKNPTVTLNDHLGRSTDAWCANKLSKPELTGMQVVDYLLVCPPEKQGEKKCNETDGRKLLTNYDLTFTAQTKLVPPNEKRTVQVILKQNNGPIQQQTVPIDIYGSVCGNGVIEPGEKCEGTNFEGKSCASLGFLGGDLECTDKCEISMDNCAY